VAAVAFVLKGYPRLSETFIAQEIFGLEALGLDIRIISLRHPTDRHIHPIHRQIKAPVHYLPEYLSHEPRRVWTAWRALRHTARYRAARAVWLRDLVRDRTPNRIRRFGQALVLAHELPSGVDRLHAHFLHTPASVARYAAFMTGLPWSISAHAKDIWTSSDWEKREKLADCAWAVTCTAIGYRHLAELAPPGRVGLVYHGIDLDRFAAPTAFGGDRDGSRADDPVRLLSVGRAVAKKGYDDLLDALARLPASLHWRLVHIGGGKLLDRLRRQADQLGLANRIEWRGPQPQDAVLAAYRRADLFVLAARVAADGDRDGLPNVLMEAQSQCLACLATRVAAVPELIDDGVTGVLVEPADSAVLSAALAGLIANPEQRARFGAAGAARVRRDFAHDLGRDTLAAQFGLRLPPRRRVDVRDGDHGAPHRPST